MLTAEEVKPIASLEQFLDAAGNPIGGYMVYLRCPVCGKLFGEVDVLVKHFKKCTSSLRRGD
jgi:hypothetical protein